LKKGLELNDEYKDITFKEFKKVYLEDLSFYREPNTVTAHRTGLKAFSDLDDSRIIDIEFLDIKKIVNKLIKQGLDTTTIRGYITPVRSLFKIAKEEYKIITINPMDGFKIKLPKPKKKKEIRVLSKNELSTLIDTIKPTKDRMIIIIASKCGLRAGEIAGLTWNDIDFKNKDLIINKQWKEDKKGNWGFGTTKSINSDRKVPFSPYVEKELRRYKEICVRELKHDRLFPENMTSSMCTRFNLKFERMGYNDISIHDLRHTYATNLIAIGLDFKTIAKYMGDTVEVVIKTYAHFNDDMYKAGKAKINKYL